ncbi:acyl-CoA dehydrogenase family protein, partial [Chloroflexota bacterium]
YLICIAKTNDKGSPEKSLSAFIINGDAKGISKTPLQSISDKYYEINFDNVVVPNTSIIGTKDEGWEIVKQIMNRAATAKCSELVGMAQQVLDMTVQYAKDRKQFDRPIGNLQIIQHYCADMFVLVEGMRLSAYQAAWKLSEGLPSMEEIAVARAWAIDAIEPIIGNAHQIHGAMGSAIEYDLHYYTRRMKTSELFLRNIDLYSEALAEAAL